MSISLICSDFLRTVANYDRGGISAPIAVLNKKFTKGSSALLPQLRDIKSVKTTFMSQYFLIFDQFKVLTSFTGQKCFHLLLVFCRQNAAGGIDHDALWLEQAAVAL